MPRSKFALWPAPGPTTQASHPEGCFCLEVLSGLGKVSGVLQGISSLFYNICILLKLLSRTLNTLSEKFECSGEKPTKQKLKTYSYGIYFRMNQICLRRQVNEYFVSDCEWLKALLGGRRHGETLQAKPKRMLGKLWLQPRLLTGETHFIC